MVVWMNSKEIVLKIYKKWYFRKGNIYIWNKLEGNILILIIVVKKFWEVGILIGKKGKIIIIKKIKIKNKI